MAQNLARNLRYAVFPVLPTKAPACPHGLHDASTDPGQIAELWRLYPAPLIGIRTGEASGIDGLDIDTTREDGLVWWRQHSDRIPPTRTYRSRSGGLHLYFRHQDGVRCGRFRASNCVDVKGEGGCITFWFAAGYPCEDHSPPAPWPVWLFELVRYRPPPPAPPYVPQANDDRAIDGIIRRVAAAAEGERNAVLYWGASRLTERGLTAQQAHALLAPAAASAGLDAREIQTTIQSAARRAA
jgi:hypothetical protein